MQLEEEVTGLTEEQDIRRGPIFLLCMRLLAGGAPPNQSVGRLGGGARNQGQRCVTPRAGHRAP